MKHTERAGFCKELPDSAHDMKYYVYEGFLVDKCGYKATFTMEDYEQFKAERLQMYRGFSETNSYCYAEETKRYANLQDMEKHRIDFLGKLIPEEECSQYYFLCYSLYDSGEIYNYSGVLCNDETAELIEFNYYGPMGRGTDADKEEVSGLKSVFMIATILGWIVFGIFAFQLLKKISKEKVD